MIEWLVAITTGALAGGFYFGGLWLTARRIAAKGRGAGLAMISWLARMTLLSAVFYALSCRSAGLALVGFGGFWLTRVYLLFRLGGGNDAV
jgi:F1F0 ATPase subunit 2